MRRRACVGSRSHSSSSRSTWWRWTSVNSNCATMRRASAGSSFSIDASRRSRSGSGWRSCRRSQRRRLTLPAPVYRVKAQIASRRSATKPSRSYSRDGAGGLAASTLSPTPRDAASCELGEPLLDERGAEAAAALARADRDILQPAGAPVQRAADERRRRARRATTRSGRTRSRQSSTGASRRARSGRTGCPSHHTPRRAGRARARASAGSKVRTCDAGGPLGLGERAVERAPHRERLLARAGSRCAARSPSRAARARFSVRKPSCARPSDCAREQHVARRRPAARLHEPLARHHGGVPDDAPPSSASQVSVASAKLGSSQSPTRSRSDPDGEQLGHGVAGRRVVPGAGESPRRDCPGPGGTLPVRPPSSSGLGLRPFTPAARVRIPLGVYRHLSWSQDGANTRVA